MIIEFHLTGENRKALVKAISEILEISAEYQYMSTCAYKIGECYTVTKEGDLEISDSADGKEIEMLISELASRGYEIPSANKLTVQMPADFFTEHTLNNLYQICKNKAVLFQAAFKTDSLDIIQSDDKVEFPWFTVENDGAWTLGLSVAARTCVVWLYAERQASLVFRPQANDHLEF
jgi:hypothetical protein